jgi:hypothetical protein
MEQGATVQEEVPPSIQPPDQTPIQSQPTTSSKTPIWPSPVVENFNDPDWPILEADDTDVRNWVTSNKRLLLRTVTWNMCARPPPSKEELTINLLSKKLVAFFPRFVE